MEKNVQPQPSDKEVRDRLHKIIDQLPASSVKKIAERIEPAAGHFLRRETAWKN